MTTRYLICTEVKNASGTQTWFADADSEDEALEMHERGESCFYDEEVEVTALEEPEICGSTSLDDFGTREQPLQPDCRTCDFLIMDHCCRCVKACTNGDKYEAAPAVVLWRTE